METRNYLFIIPLIIALIVGSVLVGLTIVPTRVDRLPTDTVEVEVVRELPAKTSTVMEKPDGVDATANPEPILIDGKALMQKQCTKCHMPTWIKQVKKTRVEWEMTLVQMEELNVTLNDLEKAALLDYLAIPDEQ